MLATSKISYMYIICKENKLKLFVGFIGIPNYIAKNIFY